MKNAPDTSSLKFQYHLTPDQVYITRDANYPSVVTLTLAITNDTDSDIAVKGIYLAFSVGDGMFDLTNVGTGIDVSSFQPKTWSIAEMEAGQYKMLPLSPVTGIKKGETITFQWSNVQINNATGTAMIQIKEEYAGDGLSGILDVNKVKSDLEVNSFAGTPPSISPGASCTLAWATTAANKVTLSPGTYKDLKTTGSVEVKPSETTTYTLTAFGDGPAVEKQFTVEVTKVGITSFMGDPTTIAENGKSTLSWQTMNADKVTLSPGGNDKLKPNDSLTVQLAETTVYTLTAFQGEDKAQKQLTITVAPVVIKAFSASSNSPVKAGSEVTLSWETAYATSWKIEAKPKKQPAYTLELNGEKDSIAVHPESDTSFTLVCDGFDGPVSKTIEVPVLSADIKSFAANPATIKAGDTFSLAWDIENATSQEMTAEWSNPGKPHQSPPNPTKIQTSQTWKSSLGNSVTFTLKATGANGSVSTKVTVKVEDEPYVNIRVASRTFYENFCEWNTKNTKERVLNGGPIHNEKLPENGEKTVDAGSGTNQPAFTATLHATPTASHSLEVYQNVWFGTDDD